MTNGAPPRAEPATFLTNTSTTQDVYPASELTAMLAQVQMIATQGFVGSGKDEGVQRAGDVDVEWPACLACAVVDRVRQWAGMPRSGVCATCLERYCLN